MDCSTRIELVTCLKSGEKGSSCGLECQYIGLTKRIAKKRWGEQKTSAKTLLQASSKPVGFYFSRKDHEICDMCFVVIGAVKAKNPFFFEA